MYIVLKSASDLTHNLWRQVTEGKLHLKNFYRAESLAEARDLAWNFEGNEHVLIIFGQDDILNFSDIVETFEAVCDDPWFVYYGQVPAEGLPNGVHATLAPGFSRDLMTFTVFLLYADCENLESMQELASRPTRDGENRPHPRVINIKRKFF